ncbi:hypothetical protein [Vibrio alginolyticus]|uniref:hypothetical protein n=1 Tax=Vibrio alginolyticus TaxID=663 RepID=UPI00215C4D66|nr:hypothetical protein [Vibrio alginolyticus]MCR9528150.1 hypothetical protein [Vibrio alginolyticus]
MSWFDVNQLEQCMRFYLRLLLSLCFCSVTFPALSTPSWWQDTLSAMPYSNLKERIEKSGSWYSCEVQLLDNSTFISAFCLDDFSYYQQHLYGEVVLRRESAQFSFLTEYEWQRLNDLLLNLRKDGLVLRRVTIGQEHYDVVEALEKKSSELVDKEVILLMNRYPQEAILSLLWVKPDEFLTPSPSLNVQLRSDGEIIEVKVTRF